MFLFSSFKKYFIFFIFLEKEMMEGKVFVGD